ncbi:MAG TPA: tail fiber protein [Jatrophihabitans sp.]|nr:tail fiber protein [Jatrophihabitans sp.]
MSTPYIGEIRIFAGNFAPVGWLLCQGQLLPISQYDVLFNLIGTTYGGDGQNTFALPNLASRIPYHQGSGYVLGQMAGVEQVTLTQQQIPVHTHQANASSAASTQPGPAGNVWADWNSPVYQSTASAPNTTMSPQSLLPAGGSQPHDNMPPFLCLNFIIATEGIYPSPN